MYIDVFNGDADGICALHQLRLSHPIENNQLVTGLKRDINLLSKVSASEGDKITVLDISLDKNRDNLIELLNLGADITYFDHHYAGDIPNHNRLTTHIDTQPTICTSLLVNQSLQGKHLLWAVTAAFGDNLFQSAKEAARPLSLPSSKLNLLKNLGTCINYNGYGGSIDDLFFHPAELYKKLIPFENPFDFIKEENAYAILFDGYKEDMLKADTVVSEFDNAIGSVFILPNEKWARRVSGIFGNSLAQRFPNKAHAILSLRNEGIYQVSVRAPISVKEGADTLCRQFETGGGRKAAAGINELPAGTIDFFIKAFLKQFTI